MNEPLLSEDPKGRDWTPGEFAGRFFLQRLTLELAGREPLKVGKMWIEKMVGAIRHEDKHILITGRGPVESYVHKRKAGFLFRRSQPEIGFRQRPFLPALRRGEASA